MSEVRLQVKNLCKNFGITKAVQNVSFNVNKGEVHALIGENGSGKSTLTNMLTGIYSIGSGQFILDGKEIATVKMKNENINITIKKIQDKNDKKENYAAYWEKDSVFYQISGKMQQSEFIKLVKNIKF